MMFICNARDYEKNGTKLQIYYLIKLLSKLKMYLIFLINQSGQTFFEVKNNLTGLLKTNTYLFLSVLFSFTIFHSIHSLWLSSSDIFSNFKPVPGLLTK